MAPKESTKEENNKSAIAISVPDRLGAPQGRRGKRQEDGTEYDRTGPPAVVQSRARLPG